MLTAYASTGTDKAYEVLGKIEQVILFPLLTFMLTLALLMFLWGVYEYVRDAENEEARGTGKRHILYGVIGLVVMLSALAILKIGAATFGVTIPAR